MNFYPLIPDSKLILNRCDRTQILGKPKGTIQKSKFDKHAEKIKELLDYGLSVRKISSVLEYTNHIALNTYINKRNLKKKLQTT